MILTGSHGKGHFEERLDVAAAHASAAKQGPVQNIALPYLWARTRLQEISDFSQGHHGEQEKKEIAGKVQ